jgi:NAD(P)H-dependent FMN reductase
MHLIISATRNNNHKLALALEETGKNLSMEVKVICLEDYELPVYTPTLEAQGVPEMALTLTELFSKAKSLIFCAPEYNGSIPPIVNNAIAWISRSGNEDWRASFNGKPAVVATHSGGGGLKVTQAMRAQLEHLGAVVIPRPVITNFSKELNPDSAKAILGQLNILAGALSR